MDGGGTALVRMSIHTPKFVCFFDHCSWRSGKSLPNSVLFSLNLSNSNTHIHTPSPGQMITQPPVSTTAALGTNATFTCRGDAEVFWSISGTQAVTPEVVPLFAQEQIYIPLPTQSYSELIITATADNNFTRPIRCLVALSSIDPPVQSEIVHLLVYGECKFL